MADYARWADNRRRSRVAGVRRDQTDPTRVAARAAEHRAKAEAHMQWVRMGHAEHFEMAQREYEMAYGEEH